ncbi:MAG: GH32 C-terminal domain-containing protein [Arachnia sp.]
MAAPQGLALTVRIGKTKFGLAGAGEQQLGLVGQRGGVDRLAAQGGQLAGGDGPRLVAVGVYVPAPYAYINRRPTFYPGPDESKTPFDTSSRRVKLRILVDNTSVELFVGDGRHVHSHRVFSAPADTGIRLYGHDGGATFRDLVIRELKAR